MNNMANHNNIQIVDDINRIAAFLAKRYLDRLDAKELFSRFGILKVDVVIILGNSIPYTAQVGAIAYKNGLANDIMIVGGIGHSTKDLVENILNDVGYKDIYVEDKPEADIFKQLIVKWGIIEEEKIIVENKSTNCGSNALEALNVLRQHKKMPGSILLIQDPTMQLRSHVSFLKEWENESTLIISYAPFIPLLKRTANNNEYINQDIKGLWREDRFIDLIMGEIPRLRDDEQGYGPKGKGFITHVDIPDEVLDSYERLLSYYIEYSEIKNRK